MRGLQPELARKLMLSVGTHRSARPLFPVEVASAMRQTLDAGTTTEELADLLHFDGPTMIRRFTRLLDLPLEVQPIVGWSSDASTVSFSAASEIARLPQYDQVNAAKAVLSNQLTLSEVRQLVQIYLRSGKSLDETVETVVRQRSTVVRRHVMVGSITSATTRQQLQELSQEERNVLLGAVLANHLSEAHSLGTKLGTENFILVGDDRFQATITRLAGGFEHAITQYIALELSNKG